MAGTAPPFTQIGLSESKVRESLRLPKNQDRWLVYDARGAIFGRGDFQTGGLAAALGVLTAEVPRFTADVLKTAFQKAERQGAFKEQLRIAAESPSGEHVALFLMRVASNCPIVDAIRALESAASADVRSGFSLVVPPTWTSQERSTFEDNFQIKVPISVMDPIATSAWAELSELYGTATTGGWLAVFGPTGIRQVRIKTVEVMNTFKEHVDARAR